MKLLCALWLVTASVSFGVEIGNTYEQVIAEEGKPRTEVAAGTKRVLQYPDMSVVLKDGKVTTVRAADGSVLSGIQSASPTLETRYASPKEEMAAAIAKVREIVNQPPPSQRDDFGIPVTVMKNAWTTWFNAGAIKPDFNTVDVRLTQELPYASYAFITSDLTVGTIYPGAQLEYNSMLQYFYMDRRLPKKRLMASEMIEINRLYRIIGRCEQQLAELQGP